MKRDPWRGPQCKCCKDRDLLTDPEGVKVVGLKVIALHVAKRSRRERRAILGYAPDRPRPTPSSLASFRVVVVPGQKARDGRRVPRDVA